MIIFQKPNKSLIIAMTALLISMISVGILQRISSSVYYIAIIIWAYEEISTGVNWFRKLLGSIVLLMTLVGLVNLM